MPVLTGNVLVNCAIFELKKKKMPVLTDGGRLSSCGVTCTENTTSDHFSLILLGIDSPAE